MMFAECATKCPAHAIVVVIAALIVGFVVGRLSKKGGKAAPQDGGKKKGPRKPLPNVEPARQPVPAGSVEIYVGNLSYDLTDEELKKVFSEYGKVDTARVVMNRFTGKSKGFGFVVMPNREEAEKAIAANSEKEYKGRKMRVNEAKNTMVNN